MSFLIKSGSPTEMIYEICEKDREAVFLAGDEVYRSLDSISAFVDFWYWADRALKMSEFRSMAEYRYVRRRLFVTYGAPEYRELTNEARLEDARSRYHGVEDRYPWLMAYLRNLRDVPVMVDEVLECEKCGVPVLDVVIDALARLFCTPYPRITHFLARVSIVERNLSLIYQMDSERPILSSDEFAKKVREVDQEIVRRVAGNEENEVADFESFLARFDLSDSDWLSCVQSKKVYFAFCEGRLLKKDFGKDTLLFLRDIPYGFFTPGVRDVIIFLSRNVEILDGLINRGFKNREIVDLMMSKRLLNTYEVADEFFHSNDDLKLYAFRDKIMSRCVMI